MLKSADLLLAPCSRIQESLGFWIPRRGFQIPGIGFRIHCQKNLDSGSPLHGPYFNMTVNTESLTVSRNGKEPIPLSASITTHDETRQARL